MFCRKSLTPCDILAIAPINDSNGIQTLVKEVKKAKFANS